MDGYPRATAIDAADCQFSRMPLNDASDDRQTEARAALRAARVAALERLLHARLLF